MVSLAALAFVLAACSDTPDRLPVQPVTPSETIRIAYRSVEVRDVSLPSYAAADEILVQDEDGTLVAIDGTLWADAPERAIALEIARHLSRLSGARVASEPWPFDSLSDARLEVRFEQLVAGADGQYHATGQYFVGSDTGRERSGLFDLSVPIDPEAGQQGLARARGQVILDLAAFIAREGLR